MKWGNSDYNAFLSRELQVAFGNIVALSNLKLAYPWPLSVPVHNHFANFTDAR